MPWNPSDATKHTKKARSPRCKRAFAHAANSILESTGDDARAVRGGNSAVNKCNAKGDKKMAKDGKWIQKADEEMEAKGTKGSFGKATPKKIAAGIKKGGKMEKKAIFAKNMKAIANKRKGIKRG
jgi:hypothetical protein